MYFFKKKTSPENIRWCSIVELSAINIDGDRCKVYEILSFFVLYVGTTRGAYSNWLLWSKIVDRAIPRVRDKIYSVEFSHGEISGTYWWIFIWIRRVDEAHTAVVSIFDEIR